ncbi:MAG TPA: PBS lyase [Pseudomonas sp.]|nr:PBS lyase [Pseudomonas sp.]
MKYLKEWLERLKSRPASGYYWEDRRHYEAREALAACRGEGDWLTLSSHGNGFVREVAVRELSEQPSPEVLPLLLERANDWVPQVRALAVAGVQRYLAPEHASALLHALLPLMALAERQRADHGPMLTAARSVLQAPEARSQVEAVFRTRHGKAARFLFALLLEAHANPVEFLRVALAHREPTVRQMAITACQALSAEQACPLLLEAYARPGASVRVTALRVLLTQLDDPRSLLGEALLDASPAVRSLARWAAPRWQVEARDVLAARLRQPAPTCKREWLGLLGLASELAVSVGEPWQSLATQAPMSSVRLAVLEGLGQSDVVQLLMTLDDPVDKVFAKALERLHEQPWSALSTAIDARLDQDWYALAGARRTALMQLRPRWQQLAYLLHRLDRAPEERTYWLQQVSDWCNRQYLIVDPTTTKDEREHLLRRVEHLEQDGLLLEGSAKRLR